MKYYKMLKEIVIVLLVIGTFIFNFSKTTTVEDYRRVDVSEHLEELKESNNKILVELKELKKDYRCLKLKLLQSGVISEYGGFLTSHNTIPPKPKKRIVLTDLVYTMREPKTFRLTEIDGTYVN